MIMPLSVNRFYSRRKYFDADVRHRLAGMTGNHLWLICASSNSLKLISPAVEHKIK